MMPITELPVGVLPELPSDVYHKRKVGIVSKSALDRIDRSPAHYRAWIDGIEDDADTPALLFGRAFHCALLEPDKFEKQFAAEPDFGDCRKKENKAARDAWRDEHYGATLISSDAAVTISGMVAAVMAHPLAKQMMRDGEPELTLSWTDDETGLPCKSRLDYYVRNHAMIVDVKTTEDARAEAFRRDVARYRYHVQDALYRAASTALGLPIEHFVLMAVEKTPPYAIATHTIDAEGVGRGYSAARRNIQTMAECVNTDTWPAYPVGITTLTLPPWAA